MRRLTLVRCYHQQRRGSPPDNATRSQRMGWPRDTLINEGTVPLVFIEAGQLQRDPPKLWDTDRGDTSSEG